MIISLGCGNERIKTDDKVEYVDKRDTPLVTIRWDLNIRPWPISDDSADQVIAHDIIEHVDDVIAVLEECHRILKPGGRLFIRTADCAHQQSFTDPTHKHWFNLESFDYFVPGTFWESKYFWYSKCRFKKLEARKEGLAELYFIMEALKL